MDLFLTKFLLMERIRFKKYIKTNKPVTNKSSNEFEINNWVLSDFLVRKIIPIVGLNSFPLNELLLMTGSICRLRPTHVFVWGTYIGRSARIFYETSEEFGLEIQIHSIDLPDEISHDEHPGRVRGLMVRKYKDVKLHQGDGLEIAMKIVKSLDKDSKILFFLDADHSYDSVVRELTTIMKELPEANILLHDTFYQSPDSKYNIGPYLAIKNCLGNINNNFSIISTNTGLPGMTLLYHK